MEPGCQVCGKPVAPKAGGGGRPKVFCSNRCAKTSWNWRRRGGPPRPGVPVRRPLTEFSVRAGWSLRKDVERIERIVADDRFSANKKQVTASLRGHLEYAAQVCQDLLRTIDQPTGD